MKEAVRIGIIGDYNPAFQTHTMTDQALQHAASSLSADVEATWVPTPSLDDGSDVLRLEAYDGLWCSAGSPYASMGGALAAVRFARERGWPFVAT